MGHKTISVRAVPDCSLQDNAFFVHDFFSRVICVEPSHWVWKLCVLLSTKCKIQSTLGLKQVSKHFLAYFSVMKTFPKKLPQLAFIIFILSELNCCPKFQFCTVKSSRWAPLFLYYLFTKNPISSNWSVHTIMSHQCFLQGENRTVRT